MVKPSKSGIKRGYARNQREEDRLKASGVKVVYRADDPDQKLRKERKILLSGDELIVAEGFRTFGKTGKEITAAVDLVHSWGARVVDLSTGRNSRDHGIALMAEACDRWVPGPEHAAMMRDKLAKKRGKPKRMPEREARAIWFDAKLSVIEKLRRMTGWTRYAAYRVFEKTNVGAGRRPKVLRSDD